ncbi:hypothetical protein N1E48_33405, partial [Pseudomonas aeruginosa]|nr:hypothetical protein [Pseudomonas aeruginosa]
SQSSRLGAAILRGATGHPLGPAPNTFSLFEASGACLIAVARLQWPFLEQDALRISGSANRSWS